MRFNPNNSEVTVVQQVKMTLTKSTKNMHRYDVPEGSMAFIDNVYISKFAFPQGAPAAIVVSFAAEVK